MAWQLQTKQISEALLYVLSWNMARLGNHNNVTRAALCQELYHVYVTALFEYISIYIDIINMYTE